ncbi:hypothetical protein WICPIJ_008245 [Wickerhamomyces pijperi]|uniref:Phosphatase PP2A regulatory subunit A/Splicing factor 3B subunit 1-like HEAT repeat domain-containing protein n=1 Tax=Wickerhamomyces pijperi TaxID=599730 RepID=A0A9P8TIZ1_WICPI|nr:hypothetical protein WICPIJ_008245 [Wickerhamomyces pijperi]
MSKQRIVFHKESQPKENYSLTQQYSVSKDALAELQEYHPDDDEESNHREDDRLLERSRLKSKFERESNYQKRRYDRELSPERDPSLSDEKLLEIREQERKEQQEKQRQKDANGEAEQEEEEDGGKTPPRKSQKRRRITDSEEDVDSAGKKLARVEQQTVQIQVKSKEDNMKKGDESFTELTYSIPELSKSSQIASSLVSEIPGVRDLQFFKEQDHKYFGKLLSVGKNPDSNELSLDEQKEIKIMKLLLKVKNGSPQVRKVAMRTMTEKAREFGAKALFNQILPLLLEKSLDDQERHLLVKVIGRVLYKLDELVKPYTHKILVVISPLLIDEDYTTRQEGREIISNLAKAVGLPHMISTLRPDIDHEDEYVRNITSRALAVVGSALGVTALLPFLKAVCRSKKSWQVRHTGVKIVQQIALIMGCGVLPHLTGLVQSVASNLTDEQLSVRVVTANSLASLAEAASPYGIESFECVLEPLWNGIRKHRGRALAAFLKCIGFLIPLMDQEYASYYSRELFKIVLREFKSPDEDMRRVVLKIVQQCAKTDGIEVKVWKRDLVPEFFKNFWVRRLALDKRSSREVVETTVVLAAKKVGVVDLTQRLINIVKDESEPFRRMAIDAVDKMARELGTAGLSERTEELLIDALLIAFQEQTKTDIVILKGVSAVIVSLDSRVKPYLDPIITTILHRLKNKTPEFREQAADLLRNISVVFKPCGELDKLNKLNQILYESLGEVFPEVLGSILFAMNSNVKCIGVKDIQPPINQLIPTLTPILQNKHEKVQESAIDLIGSIADKAPDYVSPKEWMRICFELLEMLKSTKRGIRRAANNAFGYIAKAVGPQEVLVALLNNLRVQERQLRVCTAVAIGIIAEVCSPFTVLPAVMNEYRTPDVNVQNGVLKAMTFMFEYIGGISADYMYAVTPLLEDALTDRDQVHRQTASTVVRHLALGCVGTSNEDVFVHLLNLLIPNIYETSPHVINRIVEGLVALSVALGPGMVLNYLWCGLFHPARKVRAAFWKVYNEIYVMSLDSMVPYYPKIELPETETGKAKKSSLTFDLFDAVI